MFSNFSCMFPNPNIFFQLELQFSGRGRRAGRCDIASMAPVREEEAWVGGGGGEQRGGEDERTGEEEERRGMEDNRTEHLGTTERSPSLASATC